MGSHGSTTERHRQIAYRVEFWQPISKQAEDLCFGDYTDPEGDRLGKLLHRGHASGDTQGLLIPDEAIPLVHVEAALEADHRVTTWEMVVALVYTSGEQPPATVVETGDRWDSGELRIFLFDDDESAAIGRA